MAKATETIRDYIWWMYPRGSVHYDVMVTLILAFIFITPLWVNFRDKPTPKPLSQTEVLVRPSGNGFIYTVDAAAILPGNESQTRDALLRAIEPVAGEIHLERYEAVRNDKGNVIAYKVWGHR